MPGDLQLRRKPKHSFISGDIIIVVSVIFGVLLSGGMFVRTSEYKNKSASDIAIVTRPQSGAGSGLQLQTFDIQRCTNNIAVDFLIDNSGSMQFGSKMPELKKALTTFAGSFPSVGAIALQTYSESVQNRVSFALFKDVKDKFINEVDKMKPLSATHSKDAFLAAKKSLEQGKLKYPNHKFALIFISDGIPESRQKNDLCPGGNNSEYCMVHPLLSTACRCFDTDQDPRTVAEQLKAEGTRIFTIAFTDDLADAHLNAKLQTLMREVASSPSDYFHAPIETQLTDIIGQISNKICTDY